jgi:RNA polymerase sigma-70 factor, ECF subfamily
VSDPAKAETRDAFQRACESYRRELQVHCYRILGSLHEAEDAVQETMLRAWRGSDGFEGRASLRSWLYRIATNVCLNLVAKRTSSRTLPELYGPPALAVPESPRTDIPWLEPYPDSELDGIVDADPGPAAQYEEREAMQLAFVAAIQFLPGRQRAALLLHDVVGWSGAETAEMLEMSVPAVNSALQRARETLKKLPRSEDRSKLDIATAKQRVLLDRYVAAWEAQNLDALVALLKEDAILSMPPLSEWYRGRDAIRALYAWAWKEFDYRGFRLIETAANRQPAFGLYVQKEGDPAWHARAFHVLTFDGDSISVLTNFLNAELFRSFGLSATL